MTPAAVMVFGTAACAKVKDAGCVVLGARVALLVAYGILRKEAALDNFACVFFFVLLEAHEGGSELLLRLLEGAVVFGLVLFPDLVPFVLALGHVAVGLEFQWEILLDELEPELSRLALQLCAVQFNATELPGVVNLHEDVTDGRIGEVANTVD